MKILFASLIAVSWIAVLAFSIRFIFVSFRNEKIRTTDILCLTGIAALMLFSTFYVAATGGYDIECVFKIIGNSFFNMDQLFSDKEIAPIFIKELADRTTGFSLYGFLTLNRIMPVFSMLLFYSGLRQTKISSEICLFSSAILFLNFNSLFNSASFNTAPIISLAYISFFTAFLHLTAMSEEKSPYLSLIWLFLSSFLLVMSRVELAPIIFIILSASAIRLFIYNRPCLKKPQLIAIVATGVLLLLSAFVIEMSYRPMGLLLRFTPFSNFNMQFIAENLSVVFSQYPHEQIPAVFRQFSISAAILMLFFMLPLLFISKLKTDGKYIEIPAFFAIAVYSCVIYHWQDQYPLEFIRHRLFLYIPFAYITAYSLHLIGTLSKKEKIFDILILSAALVYSVLNVRTAMTIDKNFANDLERTEWKMLIGSQNTIGKKYVVKPLFVLPPNDDINLKKKFFEHYYNRGKNSKYPEIVYISVGELSGIITPKEKEDLKKNLIPVATWGNDSIIRPGFYLFKNKNAFKQSVHYSLIKYGIGEIIYGDFEKALAFFDKAAQQECDGKCFTVYKFLASAAAGDNERANAEANLIRRDLVSNLQQGNANTSDIETAMRQAAEDNGKKLKISARQCLGYDMRFCEKILWDYMANPLYID